jgi:hypothetical protein
VVYKLDLREVDPLSATEPMVMRQQAKLEQQFNFQPFRGRPKPPEKLTDSTQTWLKE